MEAPAFSATADVALVKGKTPAGDRTWLTCSDGTARIAVVHVVHDLPHLAVESVFGLDDGLWGTLAQGGFAHAARALGQRNGRIRLVTDAPFDDLAARNWPGHLVAKAAVNAVLNRWGDGPDTPDGVRDRMRAHSPEAADLADRLDDEDIRVAAACVKRLYQEWSALPVGGTLRLTWPLRGNWLGDEPPCVVLRGGRPVFHGLEGEAGREPLGSVGKAPFPALDLITLIPNGQW